MSFTPCECCLHGQYTSPVYNVNYFMKKISILLFLIYSIPVYGFSYEVCFTPNAAHFRCATLIIKAINDAQVSLWVQAYQLKDNGIKMAIKRAYKRGISVGVILDKTQKRAAAYLKKNGIAAWRDEKVAIAHNKVMIIDEKEVITGSYNYTQSANYRNAENLIIIDDPEVAAIYKQNWLYRMAASERWD